MARNGPFRLLPLSWYGAYNFFASAVISRQNRCVRFVCRIIFTFVCCSCHCLMLNARQWNVQLAFLVFVLAQTPYVPDVIDALFTNKFLLWLFESRCWCCRFFVLLNSLFFSTRSYFFVLFTLVTRTKLQMKMKSKWNTLEIQINAYRLKNKQKQKKKSIPVNVGLCHWKPPKNKLWSAFESIVCLFCWKIHKKALGLYTNGTPTAEKVHVHWVGRWKRQQQCCWPIWCLRFSTCWQIESNDPIEMPSINIVKRPQVHSVFEAARILSKQMSLPMPTDRRLMCCVHWEIRCKVKNYSWAKHLIFWWCDRKQASKMLAFVLDIVSTNRYVPKSQNPLPEISKRKFIKITQIIE